MNKASPLRTGIRAGLTGIFCGVAGALVLNNQSHTKENDDDARAFEMLIHASAASAVAAGVKTFYQDQKASLEP